MPIHHMVDGAPHPPAPLSNAVEADGWVFLSGLTGTDPRNPQAALPVGAEAQTQRTLENLQTVLNGLQLDLTHVVTARVFLKDLKGDYADMNTAYARFFAEGQYPARTCIGVAELPGGALVEIDFIARRPE